MKYSEILNEIDFKNLAIELVTKIRGRRTRSQLSLKMKRANNFVSRWESGERDIGWNDFLYLCKITKYDTTAFNTWMQYDHDLSDSANLFRHLQGQVSTENVVDYFNYSKAKVSRLRNGKIEPSLEQILSYIHLFSNKLLEILNEIVGGENLPSTRSLWQRRETEKSVYGDHPESAALTIALNTKRYDQEDGDSIQCLSKMTSIPVEKIEQLIKLMSETDIIKKHKKKWTYSAKAIDTSSVGFHQNIRLRKYWTHRAFSKLESIQKSGDRGHSLFGYNVFMMSEDRYRNFKEQFYASYSDLVKSASHTNENFSDEGQMLYAMNLQLMCLENES